MHQETKSEQVASRRRFARSLSPLALLLVILGVFLATQGGLLGTFGYLALMQGIGLTVAIIPLAFGHNPLSKD
jgi:hypothetical protein